MTICHTCGNDYEKTFRVLTDGKSYDFDCFECAIHALAPRCQSCGCRVIGHGVQDSADIFCSAHCASTAGVAGLMDHTEVHVIA